MISTAAGIIAFKAGNKWRVPPFLNGMGASLTGLAAGVIVSAFFKVIVTEKQIPMEEEMGSGLIGGLVVGSGAAALAIGGAIATIKEMAGIVTAVVGPVQMLAGPRDIVWGTKFLGVACSTAVAGTLLHKVLGSSESLLPRIALGGIMGGIGVSLLVDKIIKLGMWEETLQEE